ncbi:MAG: hypothetical protein MUD14_26180 [Hydrococcus sp. Prado102]|nr:hypothetical protein [Hydrococcus sp. Prado102]
MKFPLSTTPFLARIHLVLLIFGYVLGGWLLATFNVPWFIYAVTLAVTFHLVKSEIAAIPLASVWVTIMVSIAAMGIWPIEISAQLWALFLLMLWILALGLVCLLAFARPSIKMLNLIRWHHPIKLVISVWFALALGLSIAWVI